MSAAGVAPDRTSRALLTLAAVAVAFAAADTYVVVLALPDMMASAGLSRATSCSGRPRSSPASCSGTSRCCLSSAGSPTCAAGVPVLVGSLLVFALGSLVTAAAYDLPWMVTGRVLQGIGGGGLLPATLALVADLYPPRERGLPLGIVGAVQELGNVLGPLYGAVVLAFGDWRDIFWINLALGLVLAAVIRARAPRSLLVGDDPSSRASRDMIGIGLVLLALVSDCS